MRRLRAAGCVSAEEETAELLDAVPDDVTLDAWIARRERGEPLAWIVGGATFCGHRLHVDPYVYVPRPQTEELARRAADLLRAGGASAADLCTGSGAVAVHLRASNPSAIVVGVDIDVRAATCARRNGVRTVLGDLGEPLRRGVFDVVTAAPPYVPTDELELLPPDVRHYEPESALHGGPDGLDVVRRVITAGSRMLRAGGWLLMEIGGDQDRALTPELADAGFGSIEAWFDEDGDLRGIAAQAR